MPKRNFVAMGQAGLTGRTRAAVQPVARAAARWTGRPEAQILSLIGAGFLAISLIDFLRQVDAVITAGRPRRQPGTLPLPVPRTGRGAPSSTCRPGRRAGNPGYSSHSKDDDKQRRKSKWRGP